MVGGFFGRGTFREPGEPVYRLAAGERWRHRLRYAGSGIMDMNALADKQTEVDGAEQVQAIQTIVEGELVMDVLEKGEGWIRVAYSLPKAEVVLTAGGQPLLDTAAAIEADLAQPVFAEVDLRGRIL